MQQLRIGNEFLITIKRLGINGEGIGFYKKKAVFIDNTIPGEEVIARCKTINKGYIEAELVRIKKKSDKRTEPKCDIYYKCGGCQIQHIDYDYGLELKREVIINALDRYTNLDVSKLNTKNTIGQEDPWFYRNKVQLPIINKGSNILMGLYQKDTNDITELTECPVQNKEINKVLKEIKKIIRNNKIEVGKYGIKFVVVRHSKELDKLQVTFITKNESLDKMNYLVNQVSRIKNVVSIAQNINPKKTSLVFGSKTKILYGDKHIEDKLGNVSFLLSPRDFYQLNPNQTIKLYDVIKSAITRMDKEILDCYSGVGTIGQYIASDKVNIRGIETIPSAVKAANKNAKRNKINAEYSVGKVEDVLPKWVKKGYKPDVIIVDPPRVGLDEKLLTTLLKVKPRKIIYVSCNPSTLAKDINTISKYYRIEWIQPVDMFPQTAHIESVVLLTKK